LSERKGEKLGKVFEGETMLSLVVNEKTDWLIKWPWSLFTILEFTFDIRFEYVW
jgi:hypothetical protein